MQVPADMVYWGAGQWGKYTVGPGTGHHWPRSWLFLPGKAQEEEVAEEVRGARRVQSPYPGLGRRL